MHRTVADLIKALSELPPDAVVMTSSPPFCGVNVIPQDGGSIMISAPNAEDLGLTQ